MNLLLQTKEDAETHFGKKATMAPNLLGMVAQGEEAFGFLTGDMSEGFEVTVVDDTDFATRSIEAGVPEEGLGCHLALIEGYAVSGLVPAEVIMRLLEERPDIAGITLPGMPANAPGMAPMAMPAGRQTELKLGEGKLDVNVTVHDDRITAATSMPQPMSLVRINTGNTNPAGYGR